MDNEIQLISDGDGLAVIGEPMAVETFLRAEALWYVSKRFDLGRLRSLLGIAFVIVGRRSRSAAVTASGSTPPSRRRCHGERVMAVRSNARKR
jgi:hypothetical protein